MGLRLYNQSQAAKKMGITLSELTSLIKDGVINASPQPKGYIDSDEVERYRKGQKIQAKREESDYSAHIETDLDIKPDETYVLTIDEFSAEFKGSEILANKKGGQGGNNRESFFVSLMSNELSQEYPKDKTIYHRFLTDLFELGYMESKEVLENERGLETKGYKISLRDAAERMKEERAGSDKGSGSKGNKKPKISADHTSVNRKKEVGAYRTREEQSSKGAFRNKPRNIYRTRMNYLWRNLLCGGAVDGKYIPPSSITLGEILERDKSKVYENNMHMLLADLERCGVEVTGKPPGTEKAVKPVEKL